MSYENWQLLKGAIAQNDTQKTYLGLDGLQVSTQHNTSLFTKNVNLIGLLSYLQALGRKAKKQNKTEAYSIINWMSHACISHAYILSKYIKMSWYVSFRL